MIKQSLISVLIIFFISFGNMLQAQDFSVKPGLIRMENDKLSLGLNVEAEYEQEKTLTSETTYPRLRSLDLKAVGTLLANPDLNPKTQHVDFFWGYLISFSKGQDDFVLGEEPKPSKDYGSLGLGLNASYESDQNFSEQNLEGGIELRYMNASKSYVPVLHAAFNFVKPLNSELRDGLNEDYKHFYRAEATLQWTLLFKRILLNPEFRYFRSLDLSSAVENTGLDKGLHGAVTLGYVFEGMDKPLMEYLRHVFVQYNRGQLPVYTDQRETIEAGLTFSF